jgi:hypothetical protein
LDIVERTALAIGDFSHKRVVLDELSVDGLPMEVQGVTTMPGRKSNRMANITATLPIQLLDKIDEMIEEDKAPSRSFVIREAVRKYLKEFERK